MKFNKFDHAMMESAYTWARLSYCKKRQVGAVIAKDNRQISQGYNGTIPGGENKCEDLVMVCSRCNKDIIIAEYPKLKNDGSIYETDCNHCGHINSYSDAEGEYHDVRKHLKWKTNDFVLHAEQNALINANKFGIPVMGATLYVTTSPCNMCAKLIAGHEISRVVYDEVYRSTEGIEFLKKVGIEVIKYEREDNE